MAAATSAMTSRFIIVLLGLLLGIQPIATDLYLSALPALRLELAASIAQTQLTLSSLMLAFGVGQMVLGPISDRIGRRPVLLWGVALFTLCGVANTFARNIEWLIFTRALQGIAMGASVMTARAVIRDLYTPEQGAIVMSRGLTGLGVTALLSAMIGSLLSEYLGWRATLFAPVLFGGLLWLIVVFRFVETLEQANPDATRLKTLVNTWRGFILHRGFLTYSAIATLSYLALFTYLASSSFVLIQNLGLSRLQYGVAMGFMPIFYMSGTVYCRRLLRRYGLQKSVQHAASITLCASLSIFGLAYAAEWWPVLHHPMAILVPFYIFTVGHGVMQSCGQSGAVAYFPQTAGAASAMNGFIMMLGSFGMSVWLGGHLDNTVFALTNGIAFWCLLLSLVAWFIVPRFGKLPD